MDSRTRIQLACSAAIGPILIFNFYLGLAYVLIWLLYVSITERSQMREVHVPSPVLMLLVIVMALLIIHPEDATFPERFLAGVAILIAVLTYQPLSSAVERNALGLSIGGGIASVSLLVWSVVEAVQLNFGQVNTVTYHPNISAALSIAVGALAAPLLWSGVKAAIVLGRISLVAVAVVVVLSGSRGGLVGLGVALGVWCCLAILPRVAGLRWLLQPTVLVVVGLGLQLGIRIMAMGAALPPSNFGGASASFNNPVTSGVNQTTAIGRFVELANPVAASGARIAGWMVARQLIAERPFTGYGFSQAFVHYRYEANDRLLVSNLHPHSTLLLVMLQGGAVLLTALTYWLASLMYSICKLVANGYRTAALSIAMIMGLMGADAFDVILGNSQVGFVALLAAFAVRSRPSHSREVM